MNELLFPPEMSLTIEQIEKNDHHVDIYVRSQHPKATCPDCGTISRKIHGRYWRHPQDSPWLGASVRLHIEVRRFICHKKGCKRKTFAERFTELLLCKARRTGRLREQHLAAAHALGGEAGSRLSHLLGMSISGDTLLRDIHQSPGASEPTVRVVGVDDWAMKKGSRYGTILVDLERRRPIAVLDSRETEAVTTWFQSHPEVEIISRDRGKNYIKAATEGAPQAQQVADRWHLLVNLRETVTNFLQQKPVCLKAAAQEPEVEHPEEEPLPENGAGEQSASRDTDLKQEGKMTRAEQEKAARHARRQARYDRVRVLKEAGYSGRAIARHLKISTRTVRKYLEAESCPQYPSGRVRSSKLTPWLPYLEERWQAGCTNASQLWREIKEKGFSGCQGLVMRWAARQRPLLPIENRYSRQQGKQIKPTLSRRQQPVPWSAQRASWLVVLTDDKLDDDEKSARMRMLAADTDLVVVDHLARKFVEIVKERRQHELDQWLTDAIASGIKVLQSFANGLRADLSAVRNAVSLKWSNGQTEGQINRLKTLKRQMYGRASIDLLRKRVLYRPAESG